MRKNGINRELQPIEGGICAPNGFKANGMYCGVIENEDKKPDVALILGDKAYATACVFAKTKKVGAPVYVSKRHLKKGAIRAVIVNSGAANVFQIDGELLSENICRVFSQKLGIEETEILIASTGKIGQALTITPFENGVKDLVNGLGCQSIHSEKALLVLGTEEEKAHQISFSFALGDYSCKIGAIFKGGKHVCPNMATTLGIITTDVNISSAMLQKALAAEVKDSFNLLNIDGISSPNDMLCIMASGKAGNYIIDQADSEYKKFCYFLRVVLKTMCKQLVLGREDGKLLLCQVKGASSKQVAQKIAKEVVGAFSFRSDIKKGHLDVDGLLFCVLQSDDDLDWSSLRVHAKGNGKELFLFEDGRSLSYTKESISSLFLGDTIEICIDLGQGNYNGEAFGCIG